MHSSFSKIEYRPTEAAWTGYEPFLKQIVETRGVRTVCDLGGGANPVFQLDYIREHKLDYTVLDISARELEKAPDEYNKVVADIASPSFTPGDRRFDLVFSKMLAEHISDAKQFHTNIANILTPGGVAVHFFPTLYALPFIVNWMIPEFFSSTLLNLIAPRDRFQHEKFPAYYQWCRGPTSRQFARLSSVGLDVVQYIGFFGHTAYYRRTPGIKQLHEMTTKFLLKHPNPHLTSFAFLTVTPSPRQ